LLPLPKLPDEWRGKRGTVIAPPADQAEITAAARWTWVTLDGEPGEPEVVRYFYRTEIRALSLPEMVAELA